MLDLCHIDTEASPKKENFKNMEISLRKQELNEKEMYLEDESTITKLGMIRHGKRRKGVK